MATGGLQVSAGDESRKTSPIVPFLLGTAVGATTGVLAGALLSRYGVHLVAALISAIERRDGRDDRDQIRFELLLQ